MFGSAKCDFFLFRFVDLQYYWQSSPSSAMRADVTLAGTVTGAVAKGVVPGRHGELQFLVN
jgi:hypothetical protein